MLPAESPVTIPATTFALVLLLLQTPPGVGSVKVIDEPTHTTDGPDILPTVEEGTTVTVFVDTVVPHPLVTEYMIVSIPAVIPVTTPPTTVAVALLLPQVPPAVVSVKIIDDPIQTFDGPFIAPPYAPTTIAFVAAHMPGTR